MSGMEGHPPYKSRLQIYMLEVVVTRHYERHHGRMYDVRRIWHVTRVRT